MKIRKGFVSNSSSSSFVVMTAGDEELIDAGYGRGEFEEDSTSIGIDELIAKLQAAKEKGAETVVITYGGGYNG